MTKREYGTNLKIRFATDSRINGIQKSVFSEISKKKDREAKVGNTFASRSNKNKQWAQKQLLREINRNSQKVESP
ncbi:hypothetical protein DVW83_02355 [Enterococcus sp. VV15]|nr:hypothetical protein DVW83_02355 [Enterococcus sp. VV15]